MKILFLGDIVGDSGLEAVKKFLPIKISGTTFYKPSNNKKENEFKDLLKNLWKEKYNY